MLKRILVLLKYPIFIIAILVGIVSCEKDFKNIGEDILDSNLFSTGIYSSQIRAHSLRTNSNQTSGMEVYLLGYTKNNDFGSIRASFVTQLTLAQANPDFGKNAVIDSVIITIPYFSTLDGKQDAVDPKDPAKTIKVPNFKLDSVYTSGTNKDFQLQIHELGTFLNNLDPNNPYEENKLYSNDVFQKTGTALYSGLISPNRNDTMLVVNRYKYENASLTNRVLYKKDTVKKSNSKPFLAIPLNKQKIKEIFQDNASMSYFSSNDNFKHYFRGLYFDAMDSGNGTVAMYLNLKEASMTIYYSETEIKDETADQDLDDDGIKGEIGVAVPSAKNFTYAFTGMKANLFERNHNGTICESYLANPNITNGDDKIFVHGAAGSDGIIHLFGNDDTELENLRSKNWLINDAKLYFYIDPTNTTNQYPEKLYLYEIKNGAKIQTSEMMIKGKDLVGGKLILDKDKKPDYYLFHLTDYITKIAKSSSGDYIVKDFGVKVFDSHDVPTAKTDTIMRKFNNDFKGVILTGNVPGVQARELKLDIYYTEKNQ